MFPDVAETRKIAAWCARSSGLSFEDALGEINLRLVEVSRSHPDADQLFLLKCAWNRARDLRRKQSRHTLLFVPLDDRCQSLDPTNTVERLEALLTLRRLEKGLSSFQKQTAAWVEEKPRTAQAALGVSKFTWHSRRRALRDAAQRQMAQG